MNLKENMKRFRTKNLHEQDKQTADKIDNIMDLTDYLILIPGLSGVASIARIIKDLLDQEKVTHETAMLMLKLIPLLKTPVKVKTTLELLAAEKLSPELLKKKYKR